MNTKRKIKEIIFIIITLLIAITSLIVVSNAIELREDEVMETITDGRKIIKAKISSYSFISSSYKKIELFPIDSSVFNSDSDFFCAQHGTPYGTYNSSTLGSSYHQTYTISKHRVSGNTKIIDPTGDVPDEGNTPDIYVNKDGKLIINEEIGPYYGYKNKNESPSDSIYTNWVYIKEDLKFDCEGNSSNHTRSKLWNIRCRNGFLISMF